MPSNLIKFFFALNVALLCKQAGAVGFGEISLQSRVGQPLQATVRLLISDGETFDRRCFALAAPRDTELPGIPSAKVRGDRAGEHWQLIITTAEPISEPVFALALRTICGTELRRDYTLIPEAPLPQAEIERPVVAIASRPRPASAAKPLGNNEISSAAHLSTSLGEIPARRKRGSRPPSRPTKPATTGDRLLLGGPVLPEGAEPPADNPGGDEERLLKLEMSLQHLTQELDQINSALNLKSESLALQQKLKLAQALPAPTTEGNPRPPNGRAWLELLLSAIVSGAITTGIAHLLSRRRPGYTGLSTSTNSQSRPKRSARKTAKD